MARQNRYSAAVNNAASKLDRSACRLTASDQNETACRATASIAVGPSKA